MELYTVVVAAVVAVIFVVLAAEDARTQLVSVRGAQLATAVAVVGLGVPGLVAGLWTRLMGAVLGAALVTGVQLVPYLLQRRMSRNWIGRADVRLAVPFGWVLGWFGIGFVVIGFALSLIGGLVACAITRRREIPFVQFWTVGLVLGTGLAVVLGT